MRHALRLSLALLVLGLSASPARAQNAADRVFPPGGQRGATVTLTFPAMEKMDSATLVVDGEGLRGLGPFVKGVGKVEIAADAEPGVRQIRVVGTKWSTAPRPFAVGVLAEVLEREPNDTFEAAQRLESLPLTLNGAIPKPGDTDTYRVPLKRGDFLVVASESRRLAGPVYLDLHVRNTRGGSVPVDMDTRRRDPVFTCAIPADGEYFLQLCDVTSNLGNIDEGCQYRLHLTTGPWLDYVTPPSATRGTTARFDVHGWNFGGRPGPGSTSLDQSIPSTAGTSFSLTTANAPNRLSLRVGAEPEGEEKEPNDSPGAANDLSLPNVVHGTLGKRGDVDCYRFAARAREKLRINVVARELDSLADTRFTVLDAAGKVLLSEDDAPRTRDPSAVWTAPADGTYTLAVEDVAGNSRGGPSSFYRVSISPPAPELSIVAKEPTLTVKAGEKAEWAFTVYQSYQPGEVTLRVEGLPAGVTAEPVKIPASPDRNGQAQVKIVLTAAAGAQPGFAPLRIIAETGGGAPVAADAIWMLTGDGDVPLGTGNSSKLVLVVPA